MEASFPRRGKMGERMLYMKKFLSLLLVLGLLGAPGFALLCLLHWVLGQTA